MASGAPMIGATDTLASGVCGCGAGVATAVSGVDEPGRLKPPISTRPEELTGSSEKVPSSRIDWMFGEAARRSK